MTHNRLESVATARSIAAAFAALGAVVVQETLPRRILGCAKWNGKYIGACVICCRINRFGGFRFNSPDAVATVTRLERSYHLDFPDLEVEAVCLKHIATALGEALAVAEKGSVTIYLYATTTE